MSDPTPYARRSPMEHERDLAGDDLVKRLRKREDSFRDVGIILCEDYAEAAARIEALEAQIAEARELFVAIRNNPAQARGMAIVAIDALAGETR